MKSKLYSAQATTKGGRNGHSEISDGSLKLDLAIPKEMGGTGNAGANPEQLFAMGYSACFGGAIEHVARQHHKTLQDIQVTAHVSIGPRDKGGFERPEGAREYSLNDMIYLIASIASILLQN